MVEKHKYPRYLRVRDLCQLLSLPPSTAYRMIHEGRLKVVRLFVSPDNPRGVIRIPRSEIDRLVRDFPQDAAS